MGSLDAESFLFERTASRLIEMRSAAYLASRMARIDTQNSGDAAAVAAEA